VAHSNRPVAIKRGEGGQLKKNDWKVRSHVYIDFIENGISISLYSGEMPKLHSTNGIQIVTTQIPSTGATF